MREFETGATRDTDEGKIDPEGFLSPLVVLRYSEYMNENRVQADGFIRASDNWQKGIPEDAYMASKWRHFLDTWLHHRGLGDLATTDVERALCAELFNTMGMLHVILEAKLRDRETTELLEAGMITPEEVRAAETNLDAAGDDAAPTRGQIMRREVAEGPRKTWGMGGVYSG